MNKKIGLSLALACIFFANEALAEKMGFINDPKLVQKSTALQGLQVQRDKMLALLKIDFEKEAQDIMNQKQELREEQASLSQEEVGKRLDVINKAENDLKERVNNAGAELQKNYLDAVTAFKEKALNPVVKELAEENKFDAVLNTANAFYVKDELDITDEAIERVNKKMPKIELKKVSMDKEETKKETKPAKKAKTSKKSK